MAEVIALVLVFLLSIVFLVVGSLRASEMQTKEDIFSASPGLDKFQVSKTILAANIGLSGGIYWFVINGGTNGFWIILWGPIVILLGMYLNAFFVQKFVDEKFFTEYSSFYTLVTSVFGKKSTSYIVLFVTSIGSLTILLAEIHLSLGILKIFFPNVSVFNVGATALIVGCVTLYALLGGLAGIVRNDWIQNFLVFIVVIILGMTYFAEDFDTTTIQNFNLTFRDEFIPLNFNLIMWLVIVNLFFIPSQLRFWQIAGASIDRHQFVSGLQRAAIQTSLVWTVLALVGMSLSIYFGVTFDSLQELLLFFKGNPSNVVANVSFILLIIAGFSALVSTADTAIISLAQLGSDIALQKNNSMGFQRAMIASVGILAFVLYLVIFKLAGKNFNTIFTSAFSLFVLIAPMVSLGIIFPDRARQKPYQLFSLVGLVLAATIILSTTYFVEVSPIKNSLWAGVIGFMVAGLFSLLGWFFANKQIQSLENG